MAEQTPVLVDMLGELQIVLYPGNSKHVIGKFTPETGFLSYKLACDRAVNIVMDVQSITDHPILTFYTKADWQSFGVIHSVSQFFGVVPRVFVVTNLGEMVNMADFYYVPVSVPNEGEKSPEIISAHAN